MNRSERMKQLWADPVWRAANIERIKRGWKDSSRAARSQASKQLWADPVMRERMNHRGPLGRKMFACARCGIEYQAVWRKDSYCDGCRRVQGQKFGVEAACAVCGSRMVRKNGSHRFCSQKCRNKWHSRAKRKVMV